jgi:hypothetical protein
MKIEEHISELLFEHDCVIVPDFGGFVCNYAPARIDPVKHLFEPPDKRIIFNKGLTRNDGLLAHHVSGKLKITYAQALDSIAKEVKRYKDDIQKDKRLTLDNIGLLYTDEKGNLLFQQDNKQNYLAESFGLSAFYHLPAEVEKAEKEGKVIPIHNARKQNRKYAVAAVITSLVATSFVFALIGKKNNMNFSSLNIFAKKETSQYLFSPSLYKELPKPLFEAPVLPPTSSNGSAPATNNTAPAPVINKAVPVPVSGSFSIILGSFGVKENADKLVSQFSRENMHVSIVGRNPQGLYMVGYGHFNSHDAAASERDAFRKKFVKDAWIKAN